jgi:hypothetical protein
LEEAISWRGAPGERQPGERVEARAAADSSFTIDKAEMFGLFDSTADAVFANAGIFKLAAWRDEKTVLPAAVPHVLDHQKLDETLGIDAERSPRGASEQAERQHDERFSEVAVFGHFLMATAIEHIEPVSIGDRRNMNLDVQAVSVEPMRQVIGGGLADEVGIVVGENVESAQPADWLEGLDAAVRQCGPDWNPE